MSREALILAQNALRRWTDLYAKLQNDCGEVVSRKLDYNLPPADHVRALEAIAEALSARPEALTFEQVRDGIIGRMSGHTISAQDGPAFEMFMRMLERVKASECAFPSPLARKCRHGYREENCGLCHPELEPKETPQSGA